MLPQILSSNPIALPDLRFHWLLWPLLWLPGVMVVLYFIQRFVLQSQTVRGVCFSKVPKLFGPISGLFRVGVMYGKWAMILSYERVIFVLYFIQRNDRPCLRPVPQRSKTFRAYCRCHNSLYIFEKPRLYAIKLCNPVVFANIKV